MRMSLKTNTAPRALPAITGGPATSMVIMDLVSDVVLQAHSTVAKARYSRPTSAEGAQEHATLMFTWIAGPDESSVARTVQWALRSFGVADDVSVKVRREPTRAQLAAAVLDQWRQGRVVGTPQGSLVVDFQDNPADLDVTSLSHEDTALCEYVLQMAGITEEYYVAVWSDRGLWRPRQQIARVLFDAGDAIVTAAALR
jgi:hypothetical protein